MNKLIKLFKKTENPSKCDWIFYILISFILITCFAYVDILVTGTHGVSLWDAIFKDGFFNFYKINSTLVIRGMTASAAYDLPIYLIFGIWNLPIWIASQIKFFIVADNTFSIIWMKLLPFAFSLATAYVVRLICKDIKLDKKWVNWSSFLFLTCPLVMFSVSFIGQYDIIALFFVMLGIRYYIKDDIVKFVLMFAVAIPMKLLPIFIFFPLLVLKEKKIIKVFLYSCSAFSVLMIFKLIESFMPTFLDIAPDFTSGMIGRITRGIGSELALGTPPYFLLAYMGIFIACYAVKDKTKEIMDKWTIYVSFAIYSLFMILCYSHPYWFICAAPFLTIMILQNTKNLKLNLLLETVLCCSAFIVQMIQYPWCFTTYMMQNSLVTLLTGKLPLTSVPLNSLLSFTDINLTPIMLAGWLACTIALLVVNFPKKNTTDNKAVIERSVIWSRMSIMLVIVLLLIILYIKSVS